MLPLNMRQSCARTQHHLILSLIAVALHQMPNSLLASSDREMN